ncbi:MAG: hypothetical protein DWQ06_15545 [Calditrichaeota bacterium]|nr:MAG: hypothetical protein DWQ06_15545 [Calditrichota bacterium]
MNQIQKTLAKVAKLNLVALGAIAFCNSASFAQVTIFADDFEAGAGNWNTQSTAGTGNVVWAADATPATVGATAIPFAGTACLNYNDGATYDDGSQNSGTATTINAYDISTYLVPTITFQSLVETETGLNWDQKWIEISNDNFATIAYAEQFDPATQQVWELVSIPLDPTWGNIKIRFRFDTGDDFANNTAGWFIDDFELTGQVPGAEDVGITSVVVPGGSTASSALTNYEVTVINIGTAGLSADGTVGIDIDGDGVDDGSGSFTGLAAAGATTTVIIPVNAPATAGIYTATATVSLTSGVDPNSGNDMGSVTYSVTPPCVITYPYLENFDAMTFPIDISTGFENTDPNANWQLSSGPTGNWQTGPSADHTGGGQFIYTQATNWGDFETPTLYSNCFDLSLLINPEMAFWYHMFDDNFNGVGDLHIDIADLTNGTLTQDVFVLQGSQQFSTLDPWLQAKIDLAAFAGSTIRVIFRGTKPAQSFESDIAVDDFFVGEKANDDAGITAMSTSGGSVNSPFTIDVTVENFGLNTAAGDVSIDTDGDGVDDATASFTGLASGASMVVTVNATAPATPGSYSADATVVLSSGIDGDPTNDSWSIGYSAVPSCVQAFPYTENFDTMTFPIDIATGWENTNSDPDVNWQNSSGPTPNWQTGPDFDHTSGTGQFMFTQANNWSNFEDPMLSSPCMDLSLLVSPELSFWYHMYDGNSTPMGDLHVDIEDQSFGTLTQDVFVISGNQQSSPTDPWLQAKVNLSAFAGSTVRIIFRGDKPAQTFEHDMAIDDLRVGEQATDDAAILGMTTAGSVAGAPISFDVVVYNYGLNTADGDVNVDIDGDGVTDATASFTGLAPNTSTTVTVSNGFAPVIAGNYTADATVVLSSGIDTDASNDTWSVTYSAIPGCVNAFPYVENFDAMTFPVDIATGWENTDGVANWQPSFGPTPNWQTGPDFDHTGSGQFMFTQADNWSNAETPTLAAPCMDLSFLTSPELSFWYHMYDEDVLNAIGDLHIDIEDQTAGTVTQDVFVISGGNQQFSSTDPWLQAKVDLSAFVGSTIRIFFRGDKPVQSFESDIAIDDVTVGEQAADDVAILGMTTAGSIAGTPISFDVEIFNYGTNTADGDVNIDIDGDGVDDATASFTGLASGASTIVTVSNGFAPATPGSYTADATVVATSGIDSDASNDSWSTTYNAIPPCVNAFPYTENFDAMTFPIDIATGWENTDPDANWQITSVGTNWQTGPSADHTSGSGMFAYTQASDWTNIESPSLSSPCMDLSFLTAPELSFWYHMYDGNAAGIGDLHVDVLNFTTGVTTQDVFTISGLQQNAPTDPWLQAKVDLSAFLGETVRIIFRGDKPSQSFESDIAIDDVVIDEQASEDVGVTLVTIVGSAFVGNTMTIDVDVKNFGLNPADGDVDVDIDGDGVSDGTSSFTGLASTLTTTVTVTATAPATIGTFSADATVTLTSGVDSNNLNDMDSENYTTVPTVNVGIVDILHPATIAGGFAIDFDVIVENFGMNPADGNVDFDWDNDGTPDATDSFVGLASGAQATLTFSTISPVAIGAANVSATVTQTNDTDADPTDDDRNSSYYVVPASGGPDTFGHTWCSSLDGAIPVDFFDISTMGTSFGTPIVGSDDSTEPFTIPFNFPFYGTDYTSGSVNANGWINFDATFSGSLWTPSPLVTNSNNMIAAWYDDLHLGAGDLFEYYDSANSRYIIQWDQVPFRSDYLANNNTPLRNTFQVILYDDGTIELNYATMLSTVLDEAGVGISGGSLDGLEMAFNSPFLGSNMSVKIKTDIQPDPPVVMIDGATLTWPAVTGAQNYWVYKADNPNGPFTAVSVGNVLSWTDPSSTSSATPNYYVTADSDAPVVAPTSNKGSASVAITQKQFVSWNPYNVPSEVSMKNVNVFKKLQNEGKLTPKQESWLKHAIQDLEKMGLFQKKQLQQSR